jgi:3,4-dihydroxy 2-butanone 4-phosphate synthase/GTP cyclohydrolase II
MIDARIARVEVAMEAMRRGDIVIMVDDEDRENEGDLCMAAQFVTPEAINLMAKEARGLICCTLTAERCQQLGLQMMVSEDNGSAFGTNFTVSVEAASGVTTGISAADRARTVSVCCNPETKPSDLVKPGHIFPLRAEPGGVLVRTGQTEGSVDLARLAGLIPAAVIVEIMNEDGTMARMPQLEIFAERHDMPIVQVADLVHYRLQRESLIERSSDQVVQTRWGEFRAVGYRSKVGGLELVAFVLGEPEQDETARVRVHAARPWADTFGGGLPGAVPDLDYGFQAISVSGSGVVLYVARAAQVSLTEAMANGERPGSTENLHTIGIGAQVLRDLGLQRIELISRRQLPVRGISGFGIDVVNIIDPRTLLAEQRSDRMTH